MKVTKKGLYLLCSHVLHKVYFWLITWLYYSCDIFICGLEATILVFDSLSRCLDSQGWALCCSPGLKDCWLGTVLA